MYHKVEGSFYYKSGSKYIGEFLKWQNDTEQEHIRGITVKNIQANG
jgi:hypothetical protein